MHVGAYSGGRVELGGRRNCARRAERADRVQAIAAFGGDTGDGVNAVALTTDTSQQQFLTTPHA